MKTISEHVLDIIQNSIRAKATLIEVIVEESEKNDFYSLIITDNGCGMGKEVVEKSTDPFFTSRNTRKVGLGLSLLKQNAERAKGYFTIQSQENNGTVVKAGFQHSNFDRPPLGEIWDVWYFTVASHNNLKLNYRHSTDKGSYEIRSEEIRELLEGVSLNQKEIRVGILEMFKNNLEEIGTTF